MTLNKGFVTTAATTALDARLMDAAKMIRTATGTVRSGVLYTSGSTGNVVGSTSSMNVSVVSADFVLSRAVSDGAVILSNVGSVNVLLDAAPASNSRIDVVWVKQADTTQGDADSLAVFGRTSGTAAASPSKPTIPTGAMELAQVLVPAGVTATNASGVTITNTFLFTSTSGGTVRYRNVAEMRADVANLPQGSQAYVVGDGTFYLRSGVWLRLDSEAFVVAVTNTDTNLATGTTAVTLGGTATQYASSDTTLFPVRSDNVIGPLTVSGWYRVTWNVQWATNTTGQRYVEVQANDVAFSPTAADQRAASGTTNSTGSAVLQFSSGDYIKLKGWQNSGGALAHRMRVSAELLRMN